MEQYLYTIRPTRLEMVTEGPTEREASIVRLHGEYLSGLIDEGRAILFGRTQNADETTFGIVILQAGSEEEARHIMENDPTVEHGVMKAELFPYRIAGMASGPPHPEEE